MHGLPCSALQYCFGGPPDVSADSAPYLEAELCKNGSNPAMAPSILTQPGPVKPVRTDSQPSLSCISIQNKTNGTHFQAKDHSIDNQHTLGSYPSSEGFSEEDDAQENCPDLDPDRPHIPRPSIIRPQKEHAILDSLAVRSDYIEPEDGPLSDLLIQLTSRVSCWQGFKEAFLHHSPLQRPALHQPVHANQSAPLAKVHEEQSTLTVPSLSDRSSLDTQQISR
ncbi:hypothetical protein DNTS_007041 [Danionella cerebrum]|uniref:Uncharacterized protein n=1 Tax=Danionella cerebrum TaxID=2873325 RepID=A0A553R005_9TELE|nr:hypothetical protein DNTS_007041 [Danionella translucida]